VELIGARTLVQELPGDLDFTDAQIASEVSESLFGEVEALSVVQVGQSSATIAVTDGPGLLSL